MVKKVWLDLCLAVCWSCTPHTTQQRLLLKGSCLLSLKIPSSPWRLSDVTQTGARLKMASLFSSPLWHTKVGLLSWRIAQWLERWTHDRKIAGSNPCRSIFFSRVNFLCWLLFCYPFHPRVTAGAHKRPQSFCWKCRWQVTAKYACTLPMWLCTKWHGAWFYGVHRTCRDGSSFMWHQPCQRCKYTTSVDTQKAHYKKLVTPIESHASTVSLLESRE